VHRAIHGADAKDRAACTAPVIADDRPPALDLSGKRKAWFFIGRGRIGKTTLARLVAEMMDTKVARRSSRPQQLGRLAEPISRQ